MTDYTTPWAGSQFGAPSPNVNRYIGRSFLGYLALPGASTPAGALGFTVRVTNKNMINLMDKQAANFRRGGVFYQVLAVANDKMAQQIQQGMVDRLEREIDANTRRMPKPRRTQRLERALAHYNNREAYANSFSVGRPSWLDQSPARAYWRQIEYGNDAREAEVLYTNDYMKWYKPWSEGGGKDPMPPGYAHRIAIDHIGATVMLGPFPAYRYSRGAADVARRIDYKARYKEALLAALGQPGITLTGVFKSPRRATIEV